MTLIVDTAPLVALADRRDPRGGEVRSALEGEPGGLIIPAPVTAEADYLLGARLGRAARLAFLNDLVAERFSVGSLQGSDFSTVVALEERYAAIDPGLADLSVVLLAARYRTKRILTFDERDFRTLRPLDGGAFTLLPSDAQG